MDVLEAIETRRSIRRYTSDDVREQDLRTVLRAGLDAPSAGNLQSRRFYVVREPALRKKLAAAALKQDFIADAPVTVVVCADHRIEKDYGARGVELYTHLDCAAAVQNMMLAATALGLGTCWIGAFDEEKVRGVLEIPGYLRPVTLMPLGYADESPARSSRMKLETACRFI